MKSRLRLVLPTLWRLGPGAVASVAAYRLACRCGLYRHWLPVRQWNGGGSFFAPRYRFRHRPFHSPHARPFSLGQNSRWPVNSTTIPVFVKKLAIPLTGFRTLSATSRLSPEGHWSALNDFSADDIKNVWEASRFEWAPLLARAWRLTGDDRYLQTLNAWLLDWVTT